MVHPSPHLDGPQQQTVGGSVVALDMSVEAFVGPQDVRKVDTGSRSRHGTPVRRLRRTLLWVRSARYRCGLTIRRLVRACEESGTSGKEFESGAVTKE